QQGQGRRISRQRIDQEAAIARDIVLKASERPRDDAGLEQNSCWRRTRVHRIEADHYQVLRRCIDVEDLSTVAVPSRLSPSVPTNLNTRPVRPTTDGDAFLATIQQPAC